MEKTKITVTKDISSVQIEKPYMVTDTFELWWDSNIEDWVDLFRSILFRQGFQPETIERYIPDYKETAELLENADEF